MTDKIKELPELDFSTPDKDTGSIVGWLVVVASLTMWWLI